MPTKSKSKRTKRSKIPLLKPVVAMGTRVETIVDAFFTTDARRAVELYRRKYGQYPISVNGRKFLGHCQKTGQVILSGDDFFLPQMTSGFFQLRKARD